LRSLYGNGDGEPAKYHLHGFLFADLPDGGAYVYGFGLCRLVCRRDQIPDHYRRAFQHQMGQAVLYVQSAETNRLGDGATDLHTGHTPRPSCGYDRRWRGLLQRELRKYVLYLGPDFWHGHHYTSVSESLWLKTL